MGLDASDGVDDGDGGGKSLDFSNVSCSICLEPVTDNGDRSWAKLQCGHEFHLDCIGSAFNIKGAMQCPNCRKIEKGQWLFATGCRSFTDISFEDWPHDEDLYDLSYSEMSFGVQWCPITFPRLASSFEDGEFPSPAYHDLLGHHAVFAEHTAVSSSSHPCPYVAYYGPIHSSSSSSLESVSDSSSFSSHWAGPSGSSEIPSSYSFPPVDPHYHGWDHHSLPVSATGSRLVGSEQPSGPSMTQRSARTHSDMPRNASFVHPFIASQRVGSSVTSSMIPPYPGSAARARDRAQALQAYFQPPSSSLPVRTPSMPPSSRRSSGHRSMSQAGPGPGPGPTPLSSDQMNGFYAYPPGTSSRNYPEPENPIPSRIHAWERDHLSSFPITTVERDSGWVGFHQPPTGPTSGYRQRHPSERNPPPQNRP